MSQTDRPSQHSLVIEEPEIIEPFEQDDEVLDPISFPEFFTGESEEFTTEPTEQPAVEGD